MLKTAFWNKAANSLPASIRERYFAHFERAERWELALDSIVELLFRSQIQSLPRRPGRSEASSSSSG